MGDTTKALKGTQSRANTKALVGLVLAVIILVSSQLVPLPPEVTREGASALAIFLAAIVLWIAETLPMSVTCLLCMAIIPYFGIMSLNEVFASFGGTSFFFVIATFAITQALSTTTIPLRISCKLLAWSKGNPTKLVIGFMFAAALTSSIVSNLSACILYLSLLKSLLQASNCKPGSSNLGKCLMIAVPASSGVGGLITPAGTPGNMIVIDMLANIGISISFLQWTLIFTPFVLVTVAICGIWVTRIFKPEPISAKATDDLVAQRQNLGGFNSTEKKAIVIIALMIVCWFAGTWISVLNVTVVAIIGMALLFMPGIKVISWQKFSRETNWDIIFTIGSIGVLIAGLTSTGIMDWLITTVFSGTASWNPFLLFLFVGFVVCVIRAFVPTAPAIIALFGVPLLAIAEMTGLSAVALIAIPAYWACTPMLLWFEPIFLFSYGEGYYKPLDVLKYGSVPSVVMILLMTVLPAYVSLFGF